jgi:hypothetical protein
VVAPSLIRAKAGDQVKKNRRDATASRAFTRRTVETRLWSDTGHDAMRDLVWRRSAALQTVARARQRGRSDRGEKRCRNSIGHKVD